jgi:predicted DNA-binding protein YlxM (UPF0122 family)
VTGAILGGRARGTEIASKAMISRSAVDDGIQGREIALIAIAWEMELEIAGKSAEFMEFHTFVSKVSVSVF